MPTVTVPLITSLLAEPSTLLLLPAPLQLHVFAPVAVWEL